MESVLAKQSTGYVGYIVAVSLALWVLYGIIYRLYLHPLARFPGPKLAIVTYWYEFYYDVVKRGRYTWKIKDLHAEYGTLFKIQTSMPYFRETNGLQGPIIRINPNVYFHFILRFGRSNSAVVLISRNRNCISTIQTITTKSSRAPAEESKNQNGQPSALGLESIALRRCHMSSIGLEGAL